MAAKIIYLRHLIIFLSIYKTISLIVIYKTSQDILITKSLYSYIYQELKRFPTLQTELAAASYLALEKFRDDGKKTVLRLVDMESSYLTVDFFRNLPQEVENNPAHSTAKGATNHAAPPQDRYSDGHFRRIATNVSAYISMVSETLRLTIPKATVHCQVREAKRSLLNFFYSQVGRKEVPSTYLCSILFLENLHACTILIVED